MAIERRTVHFRGHVQGVGFRYTTCQVASRFCVSGTVGNLPNGSVRLIAEADAAELDRFVSAIQAEMDGRIRDTAVESSDPLGDLDGFSIAYY